MRNDKSRVLKFGILGFGLAVLLYAYSLTNKTLPVPEQKSSVVEKTHQQIMPEVQVPPASANAETKRPAAPSTKSDEMSPLEQLKQTKPIEAIIPKLEDLQKEVAADPHVTPKSLLKFSLSLSKKMDIALQSEEASQFLLQELQVCAQGSAVKTSSSASAICIKSAYELSQKYQNLSRDADAVKASANANTQQLYSRMHQLSL